MKSFAEVIESSLTGFLAQSWQWNHFPTFASLVSVTSNKRTHLAVVHQVKTGSMDPIRYPFPYQKTEEELLAEQPQIFEFLKTTFSCLTIGYQEKGKIYYLIAPEPVKIHAFINPVTPDLAKQFFSSEKYLHVLFGNAKDIFNLDELLLALLKTQDSLGIVHQDKINNFMHTYSLLTGNDYRRMKLFLQRAESTLSI